jgi:hypothetical protein
MQALWGKDVAVGTPWSAGRRRPHAGIRVKKSAQFLWTAVADPTIREAAFVNAAPSVQRRSIKSASHHGTSARALSWHRKGGVVYRWEGGSCLLASDSGPSFGMGARYRCELE